MQPNDEKYNKKRLRSSYITTVIGITLVLFMLGMLGMVLLHAKILSDHVRENITISVVIKEDTKEVGVHALQKWLGGNNYVKNISFVSKEQAAEELKESLGEDFIGFLGFNPLLDVLEVQLKAPYANNDSLKIIDQQILQNSAVKEVLYQPSLIEKVNDNIRKISFVLLGFSVLLFLVAFALINNTIRLAVYSRRLIIRSMQLVGATRSFIRKPFLTAGVLQGIIAAVLSMGMLTLVVYFARTEIPELAELQDMQLFIILFGLVLITGIVISWISTYFAVRKYLNIRTENLY